MSDPSMMAEAVGPAVTENPSTMRETLLKSTTLYSSRPAIISMYQATSCYSGHVHAHNEEALIWTYQQLKEKASQLASSLFARGIRPGMTLAVFLPNGVEWTLLFWASVELGTTFVSLDERSVQRKEEVGHFFEVTKPAAAFLPSKASAYSLVDNDAVAVNVEALIVKVIIEPVHTPLVGWENLREYFREEYRPEEFKFTFQDGKPGHHGCSDLGDIDSCTQNSSHQGENKLDTIVYILFTSGTSGLPKACPLTNQNIWASAMAAKGLYHLDSTSRVLVNGPPSHSMGVSSMLHAWLHGGAVIIPSPAFDAKLTLTAIDKMQCTHVCFVPTMALALIKQPNFHHSMTKSLKCVLLGGTIVPSSAVAAVTDPQLLNVVAATCGFGMTEGLPVCGSSLGTNHEVHSGAVTMGRVLPGVRVKVCKSQTRQVLRRGQTGELHFCGDMIIGGYLHGDSSRFYDDSFGHWIATGDEAMMDTKGNIFIFGRYKDIIIRGGVNLSPGLIEHCLHRAGSVGQVIGLPDDIAGEVPIAIVQAPDHDHIPKKVIQDFVMEVLGPTCLPTAYFTLTELGLRSFPLTTSGKVRKSELRRTVLEYLSKKAAGERSGVADSLPGVPPGADVFLRNTLASLTGSSEQSVPHDQPLSTILDSINLLRFQARIQQQLSRTIPIDRLGGDTTINSLAKELRMMSSAHSPVPKIQRRRGPPTALDMVHTQDDARSAARTALQARTLLAKYRMSWNDVEDIFPIPELSGRSFEAMRPLSYSVRIIYQSRSGSVSAIRTALEATVKSWPMFRTFAMKYDNTPLFITLGANNLSLQTFISEVPEIQSMKELEKHGFFRAKENNVHLSGGGPLARFAITRITETGYTALMVLVQHSIFDAISMSTFTRDLEANLQGSHESQPYTHYKLFADLYYQHCNSISAEKSINYQVTRLRGIGSLREDVWPPQRCIGMFIGDDTGYNIPLSLRNPMLQDRTQVESDGGFAGVLGIRRIVKLNDMEALGTNHNITAPILIKAACALLNSKISGAAEVIFAQSQAGRQWPFLEDNIAAYLPNPITIAGNTLALIMNRIYVDPNATIGSFLSQLEEEQKVLTRHAHAPLSAITAQLSAADAATFHAGRRQLLNWLPVLPDAASQQGAPKLEFYRIEGLTDVMLSWNCGVVDSNAVLTALWDGAQFGTETVTGWTDGFVAVLEWVAQTANWDKKLGDFGIPVIDGRALTNGAHT